MATTMPSTMSTDNMPSVNRTGAPSLGAARDELAEEILRNFEQMQSQRAAW
jgi:hypothetical protein